MYVISDAGGSNEGATRWENTMNPLEHYKTLLAKTYPRHQSVQEAIDAQGANLDTNSKEAKLPYYSFCIFWSPLQYERWRIWLDRQGVILSDKDIAVPDLVAARKAAVIYLGEIYLADVESNDRAQLT